MKLSDTTGDIINIPVRGGITEGGLIIIGICVVIGALLILAIAIVWKFGSDIRAAARAAREDAAHTKNEVVNHHEKNLRVDLDEKDETQNKKLDKLLATVESTNARFDRMNDRITGLDRRMTGIDTRLNSMGVNK